MKSKKASDFVARSWDLLGPAGEYRFQKLNQYKKTACLQFLKTMKIKKPSRFLFKTQNPSFTDKNWLIGLFYR
jgi:hypothetical protein